MKNPSIDFKNSPLMGRRIVLVAAATIRTFDKRGDPIILTGGRMRRDLLAGKPHRLALFIGFYVNWPGTPAATNDGSPAPGIQQHQLNRRMGQEGPTTVIIRRLPPATFAAFSRVERMVEHSRLSARPKNMGNLM